VEEFEAYAIEDLQALLESVATAYFPYHQHDPIQLYLLPDHYCYYYYKCFQKYYLHSVYADVVFQKV
jgi:hypothetical protein